MEKVQIGLLILARRESLSTKSRNGKHGSPVAWSIHYTVSAKNWLCLPYWLWPHSNSPWKTDSVRLPSCRQYGKLIETQIKWSCPFPPWMLWLFSALMLFSWDRCNRSPWKDEAVFQTLLYLNIISVSSSVIRKSCLRGANCDVYLQTNV